MRRAWTWAAIALFAAALSRSSAGRAQDEGFDDEEWDAIDASGAEADDADFGDAASPTQDAHVLPAGEDAVDETTATPSAERDAWGWPVDRAHARGLDVANTLTGSTGGFRLATAGTSTAQGLRFGFGLEMFEAGDFGVEGDTVTRTGGVLTLGYTPLSFLEVFASMSGYATTSDRARPSLVQAIGDARLGGKVFVDVMPWLALGGQAALLVPSARDLGVATDALGLELRALATADLRDLATPVPLVLRGTLGYRLDNSQYLVDDVEDARYRSLVDPAPRIDETRHLLTRHERFALGINRADFVELGLGLEGVIDLGGVGIHPIGEWTWGIPVNRHDYDCFFDAAAMGDDGCMARRGLGAAPMTFTVGARVMPPVRGLSSYVAFDIGVTGTDPGDAVRELAQNAPYQFLIGLGYAFDLRGPPPPEHVDREVERRIEVREPPPIVGRVRGLVVLKGSDTPVVDARIAYGDRGVTAQLTDAQGRFVSEAFAPGDVAMAITHADYVDGTCTATIGAEGGDVDVRCEVERPLVVIEETEIQILEQIHFAFDSAEILPESFGLMGQITQALAANPTIRRVEIQGHTDDRGAADYNLSLSQRRADSVRLWLVERGIAADRLIARGYGMTQPVVPNTDDASRARNRRVQFIIMDRDESAGAAPATP